MYYYMLSPPKKSVLTVNVHDPASTYFGPVIIEEEEEENVSFSDQPIDFEHVFDKREY